ncbi:MAG: transcription-repair coupling factor [Bacteroidales bacterium]|nr:transcription-repair coupling factor [Bacteroidales bacterium]
MAKLATPTQPAGTDTPAEMTLTDLPDLLMSMEGWPDLRAAIHTQKSGAIDGAWGSAGAVAATAVARESPLPVLLVVPSVADLATWSEDLTSFLGERPAVFPAHETWPPVPVRGRISTEASERLRTLQRLTANPPKLVLAPMAAIVQPVPPRSQLAARGKTLTTGDHADPDQLASWLVEQGYKRVEAVEYPGDFSRRGGILDIFPPDLPNPVRCEFFGDELESLRTFSPDTQRSLEPKTSIILSGLESSSDAEQTEVGFILDYFPEQSVAVLVEPADLIEQGKHFFDRIGNVSGLFTVRGTMANLMTHPTVNITAMPKLSVEATVHLRVESVERFSGNVQKIRDELDTIAASGRVLIACQTEAEVHRLTDVLKAGKLAMSQRLKLVTGHVRAGFRLVGAGVVVLGSHELFHKDLLPPGVKAPTPQATSRRVEGRAIDSFLDLNDGDYVVHIAHGIARFRGMTMLAKQSQIHDPQAPENEDSASLSLERGQWAMNAQEENLILEFRDGVMLYVPASRIDLIQKYVGGQTAQPELSKLGGTSWGRRKDKVAEAVQDMAAEMIQIQAVRAAVPGFAFPVDSDWQREFEAGFPYQETPDQLAAIAEIKGDLERPRPMDRLLCGDVGYGKTEVAIRAAFKAVDNGKQVAVLVPTTVLAEQHFRTFSQRFAEYPFLVEVVNRFKGAAKQKETLKRVAEGAVDVIIGTHRLLSKDVKFQDLGLVIIDEEQRFGVEHKERLKQFRATVHVLTMTATPIPRTLHGALLGIREISNLETPPPERQPVETRIIRWDDALIRHAIHREMTRGGQVYFVHNRVHDIGDVKAKLETTVPEATMVVGHGQMHEHDLEKAMVTFIKKEADILIATTIIESGLDIPNANTIFIDDADTYGLADLHQLRGRVGRQKNRAYAYLIVKPQKLLTPIAQKRLKAIEEFTDLGSGFKIALRDLEIRGAGNILGAEQSGHIAAIGYELYCQLLENAVRTLKQQPPRVAVEVNVDLPWPAFLPRDYVPGQKLRIEVYRRLARLRDMQTLEDFRQELTDRYGPPPAPADWLLRTTEIRLACVHWDILGVHRDGPDLVFSYRTRAKAEQLAAFSRGRVKIVDDKSLYLRLQPTEDEPRIMYDMLKSVLTATAEPDPSRNGKPPARRAR